MELKSQAPVVRSPFATSTVGMGAPSVREPAVDAALHYKLGVTRFFGVGDIGKHGLVNGWAAPEDGHVWNDGPDAELLLMLDLPARVCTIAVEGSPFIRRRQPQQDITLFANGFRIGFWRFRQNEPQTMSSVIEAEHFLPRGKSAMLKLTWHLPTSIRPSEIGEGSDDRELGFVFRSLNITAL